MEPLKTLKGLFVVLLILKALSGFTQTACESSESYLEHFEYGAPSFIQLYTGGYCITDSISDTTIYMRFYPLGKNGIIYWGYSSPQGYPLTVTSISIYNSACILISNGQIIGGLDNLLYYIRFDLRTKYVDNFCPYFIPFNPLAVKFGLIKAEMLNNTIGVDWITLSESNSNYFVVEYSYDMLRWIQATSVDASGNSSSAKYYNASFTPAYVGLIYVRVVEYDYNGNTTTSDPIYLEFNSNTIYNRLEYDLAGRLINISN